ncbi:MAG: hypothetical protein BWK80_07710, partial [Desulfobacteraceae bacterium IS3]
ECKNCIFARPKCKNEIFALLPQLNLMALKPQLGNEEKSHKFQPDISGSNECTGQCTMMNICFTTNSFHAIDFQKLNFTRKYINSSDAVRKKGIPKKI